MREMETDEKHDEKLLLGSVGGHFSFKKLPSGNMDKSTVVCKLCKKEFAYHRSTSSLRYPINAKHVAASTDNTPSSSRQCRQSTLDKMTVFRAKMSKSTIEKLTNTLAKWIAVDCWPLSVVEDQGLEAVLQIASSDPTYELPYRKTISNKIPRLYDTEKQAKVDLLEKAECVAVTGDHWTSVSNTNYVGVTAHIIDVTDRERHLKSFALTVQKTTTRHYASVAEAWGAQQKVTI